MTWYCTAGLNPLLHLFKQRLQLRWRPLNGHSAGIVDANGRPLGATPNVDLGAVLFFALCVLELLPV